MNVKAPINPAQFDEGWPAVIHAAAPARAALAEVLLAYVRPRRWFRTKARATRGARVADVVMLDGGRAALVFLDISYADGDADRYLIPLMPVDDDGARTVAELQPHAVVAWLSAGAVVDGIATGAFAPLLLALIRDSGGIRGETGALRGEAYQGLAEIIGPEPLTTQPSTAEQSNSSVVLGGRVVLKTYRQLTAGLNPELELGRVLGAHPRRPPTPRLLGALQYRDSRGAESSVALAHEFLRNDGDGWSVTLEELRRSFDRLTSDSGAANDTTSPLARSVARAKVLGRRTAEIHLALFDAAAPGAAVDPALTPEPLTDADRAAAVDGVTATWRALALALPERLPSLAPTLRADVEHLLDPHSAQRRQLDATLFRFRDQALPVVKTRVHGDLHLGQVLCWGDDFVIIDFEGEPARPLAERRAKASPLRDVVGMLRSFDYAPEAALRERPDAARTPELAAFAAAWKRAVGDGYLGAYREAVAGAPFLPPTPALQSLMLRFYELERVLYEVGYELHNRPDWIDIPLRGLCALTAPKGLR